MINEAIFCVMEGVATPEAIDTVMKLGMAHPMGPLALADFIGLDVCLAILEVLHKGLGDDKYRPCPLLRKMVAAGYLGRKSGRGFLRLLARGEARPESDAPIATSWRCRVHDARATSRCCCPTIPSCGYFGIIAIHDTTLGPALGGTRFWQYASAPTRRSPTRSGSRGG